MTEQVKHPFTDKRIASLLSSFIQWQLDSELVSFEDGGEYETKISFTVHDEELHIQSGDTYRKKKIQVTTGAPKITKETADCLTKKVIDLFFDNDLDDSTAARAIRLASIAINSHIMEPLQ